MVCGPYKDVVSGDATIEKATEAHEKATAERNASNMVFWAYVPFDSFRLLHSTLSNIAHKLRTIITLRD